jgi:hypothetical protein
MRFASRSSLSVVLTAIGLSNASPAWMGRRCVFVAEKNSSTRSCHRALSATKAF